MRDLAFIVALSIFLVVVLCLTLLPWYDVLCRQYFGGIWSSIVIDDCYGSFWSPTMTLLGHDEGLVPLPKDQVI